MARRSITSAVEELSHNPRLMRLFRRKGERALVRFRLSKSQLEAIKAGNLPGLIAAGMDPKVAARTPVSKRRYASLLLQHAPKLAPPAFAALVIALWPAATVSASPPKGERARAIRVISGLRVRTLGRRLAVRRLERTGATRARARLGALLGRTDIGLKRALRRVGGELDDGGGDVD